MFQGQPLVQLTIDGKVRWLAPSYGVEYMGDSNEERLIDFENRMLYGFLEGLASDLEVALDRDLNNDGRNSQISRCSFARLPHLPESGCLVWRSRSLKLEA